MANNIKNTFLERVINFDFDKFYTKRNRIFIHIFTWVFSAFLIQIGYYWGYHFGFQTSFLFSIRLTLCNIVVFYSLFYFVIPQTINKNKIVLFFISVFILLQIWLLINHYFYVLLYNFNISMEYGVLKNIIVENSKIPILEIIKPKKVLAFTFDILGAISPVLFVKLVFDLTKTYAKSVKANRNIERLRYENLLMENKFLQVQLNPHFLFNTFNNIYALVRKKSDVAPEVILKLSDIMKYTLYDANVEKIHVEKELNFIDNYFEMEKLRYAKDYSIEKIIINNNPELKIEPLLYFTFIENAFKYGLKSDHPYLKLFIEIKKEKMIYIIENDLGDFIEKTKNYGGIGIENAKRRLELLYPNKHKLKINRLENKFIVELEINLNV